MKYPYLVKEKYCKIPAILQLDQEGLTKYGEPLPRIQVERNCNYQSGAKVIYTKTKKEVAISGTLLFHGDICPELPEISSGIVTIFGIEREIARGTKCRNPDGTVNYTKIEVV